MPTNNKSSLDSKKDKNLIKAIKQDILNKALDKANQDSVSDEPKLKKPDWSSKENRGG